MNKLLEQLLCSSVLGNHSTTHTFLVTYLKKHQLYPLLAVHPILHYCIDSIMQECKKLPLEIDPKSLQESIINDLNPLWTAKLQRCFVLEFHQLEKDNLLHGTSEEDRFNTFVNLFDNITIIRDFLHKYPVIADQLSTFITNYVSYFKELFNHLNSDFTVLSEQFLGEYGSNIKLSHISFAGDAHNNFRRVAILAFINESNNSQVSVVYKPRSVYNEECYNQFIKWINNKAGLKLKTFRCLNKKNYGWCEWIHFSKCNHKDEINNFYHELGALVAISYILNISDIHYENLLAYGTHPVIVDLECMASPLLRIQEIAPYTVLQSGLLPHYVRSKENYMDISALSGGAEQESPFDQFTMEHIGKASFRVKRTKATLRQQPNLPKLKTASANPEAYQAQVLQGFEKVYKVVLENKNECLEGPLSLFKRSHVRLILRSTIMYVQLHYEGTHPKLLHTKSAYNQYLSWVKKNQRYGHEVARSEYNQLKQGDIPAFYIAASTGTVYDAYGKKIEVAVSKPGYERLIERVQRLSEKDLLEQKVWIERSFATIALNKTPSHVQDLSAVTYKKQSSYAQLKSEAMHVAACLLDDLYNRAHYSDALIYWAYHRNERVGETSFWNLTTTGLDLYAGLPGILLGFAYGYALLEKKPYQKLVQRGLDTLALILSRVEEKDHTTPIELGLFSGYGGVLYLCTIIERLKLGFSVQDILEQCVSLLKNRLAKWTVENYKFDLIAGLAGLMIALDQATSLPLLASQCKELLSTCRLYLLKHYANPAKLPEKAKNKQYDRALLGMSHGVSGIAWALYKSFAHDMNEKTLVWIKKALQYERKYFAVEHQDWPNLIHNPEDKLEKKDYQCDWCHGAVGIGMNRLDMYKRGWRDNIIEYEISVALNKALIKGRDKDLNLCHGKLAVADFILLANQLNFLDERYSHDYLKNILSAAQDINQIVTEKNAVAFIPGLMTGRAGLAFQLLRLANPNHVSSILV